MPDYQTQAIELFQRVQELSFEVSLQQIQVQLISETASSTIEGTSTGVDDRLTAELAKAEFALDEATDILTEVSTLIQSFQQCDPDGIIAQLNAT